MSDVGHIRERLEGREFMGVQDDLGEAECRILLAEIDRLESLLAQFAELAAPKVSPAAVPEIDYWRERMAKVRELSAHLDRMHRP